jgi:hypothetical protein
MLGGDAVPAPVLSQHRVFCAMRLGLLVTAFALTLSAAASAAPAPASPPSSPSPPAPPPVAPVPSATPVPVAPPAAPAPPRVYSDAGDIYIVRDGIKTQLTKSEQDVEPALSPDGQTVVYTRQGRGRSVPGYDLGQSCVDTPKPDQLRAVNADGSDDRLLLEGRKGEAAAQLCDFRSKQFSADGKRLYFLTPGWTTSGALHVYELRPREQRFVLPANDLLVLNFCSGKYQDDLVVEQHRYFVFGGSYDWYWLYDAAGKKELGPIGHFDSPDAMVKAARQNWCKQ